MSLLHFPAPAQDSDFPELRTEIRAFLKTELAALPPATRAVSWAGFDREFSRKLGAKGWLGMILPKEYGGQGKTALERYVVFEELLAAGAPVAGHWAADRQSASLILRHGSEKQRRAILPAVSRGECFFCIGMSEPDSGSDLAAVRTRAQPVEGGFRVNGTKLWTTYGHEADYMILFCRTDTSDNRHDGMSQLLVDMRTPGVRISPVLDIAGDHHFNEVTFTDVFLPETALIGNMGDGWQQVMGELAFERSGPERFLSSFVLITELLRAIGDAPDALSRRAVGRLTAHLLVLRRMSRSVAAMLSCGENPALQAAIVKDLGAVLEQEVPEIARLLVDAEPSPGGQGAFAATLAKTILIAPSFSLRGGTREILRGIIARGLGLR